MGKGFGNLYFIRNAVYFRVSSYEQKAFGNFWRDSLRNAFQEVKSHAPFILPPFTIAYLGAKWAMAERMRSIRKDPALWDDDGSEE